MGMAMLYVDGLQIPFEARTLNGFRKWFGGLGEDAPRASYVGGNVYVESFGGVDMTPQNFRTHAPIVQAINSALGALAVASGRGMYHCPPSWFTNAEADLSTEPDGFFVSYASLKRGLLKINPERELEMVGRPDFVLEVVSRSSPERDRVELRTKYATAGVREYWIVDALGESLRFSLLTLRRRKYVEVLPDASGWRSSPLWKRAFRLRSIRNPAGLVEYRLDVREPT